jgi:hypothetical protein
LAPVPEANQPGHQPDHDQDKPVDPGPWQVVTARYFRFRFGPASLALGAPFGITPWTTSLEVADGRLRIRYGLWRMETPLENVADTQVTGPYDLVKVAGPPRLSLVDRGLSLATSTDRGLCISFRRPVRGVDPLGLIRHPAVTVTVDDQDDLARMLAGGAA